MEITKRALSPLLLAIAALVAAGATSTCGSGWEATAPFPRLFLALLW